MLQELTTVVFITTLTIYNTVRRCLLPETTIVDGYYTIYKTKMDYEDAKEMCQSENLELVSVHNVEDNNLINDLMETHNLNKVWLDNSNLDYNNWDDVESQRQDNKDCVVMNQFGLWNTADCNQKFYPICKTSITPCTEPYKDVYTDSGSYVCTCLFDCDDMGNNYPQYLFVNFNL
jgi:hypothetical protein